MSTKVASGSALGRGARATLPIVVAGCAAAGAMLVARRLPIEFVAAGALGFIVILAIRARPLPALVGIAVVRATLEATQSHTIIGALGVGLSAADLLTIAMLVALGWWLIDQARAGKRFWTTPTFWPVTMLLLAATASLSYSSAAAVGARDITKFAAAYAVYLVVATEQPNDEWLKRLLGVVVAGAVAPIAIGWWQFVHSVGKGSFSSVHGLRIQSTFDHPNTYGFYLVAVIAAAWALRQEVSDKVRPFVTAVGIAALASTALTLSRNAWAALGVLILVLGWRDRRVIIAAVVSAVVAIVAMPRLIGRATQFLNPGTKGNSLIGRLDLWSRDFALWKQQPLIGQGWGSMGVDVSKAPHSDFMRALAEAGLIGFAAYLVFVGSLILLGIRYGSGRTGPPRILLGLTIGFVLVSFASNNLGKGAYQFYFWLVIAIAYVWSTRKHDAEQRYVPTPAPRPLEAVRP